MRFLLRRRIVESRVCKVLDVKQVLTSKSRRCRSNVFVFLLLSLVQHQGLFCDQGVDFQLCAELLHAIFREIDHYPAPIRGAFLQTTDLILP